MFGYGVPETRLVTHDGEISNCILEIPQNIHATLENNVITHKSGSILTLGGSTYTTYKLNQDRSTTISASLEDGIYFVDGTANGTPALTLQTKFGSGDTLPELPSTYSRFFLTTNKQFYHSDGTQWNESGVSYPTCLIQMSGGVASFVKDSNGNDMIFNGAGFIGHHAFIYPNVKALWSNGIDTDGTLKSGKLQNANLVIIEMATGQVYTGYNRYIGLLHDNYSNDGALKWRGYEEVDTLPDLSISREYFRYYVKDENKIYVSAGGNWLTLADYVDSTPFIEYNYNGTSVTVFNVRQPVRLATTEMLDTVQANINTIDAGAYHQPNEYVTLFDGDLGSGDIQLSDYFDSYEYLLFVFGNDDGNIMYSRMMTSYELETVLTISTGGGYALLQQANGNGYWIIEKFANGSTTTLLKYSSDDDIKVYKVIGINRKAA